MKFQQIAHYYLKNYGFNILPLKNKVPACSDWIKWQTTLMNETDINTFKWNKINGIGAVCGIKELRCIDFDNVTDPSVVKKFLRALGLPSEYAWTVRSGSGKGYHIWFYCSDDTYNFRILGGQKSYYKLNLKEGGYCDHIELRWINCQTVLPPSMHPSGKKYEFLFTKRPNTAPAAIPTGRLTTTLETFCVLESNQQHENEAVDEHQTEPQIKKSDIALAADYLSGRINNYDDWVRIGFALASYGEEGREYFLQISRNNPSYNDKETVLNRKFDGLIKDYRGKITISTLFKIAKKYGYVKPETSFWKVKEGKVRIFTDRMITLLQYHGYFKMLTNQQCIYIKDKENIISEVTKIDIKDFLLNYISGNSEGKERDQILDYFISHAHLLCADSTLECLKTVIPFFITGTRNKEFFFFKDNFVEVTKDNLIIKSYSELHGKIWEKQKSNHTYQNSDQYSEFRTLIENVCNNDTDRINAIRSAIGYLLSSYKDPSCAKAVIFIDEKLSENAHGRSCKGLVSTAVSHLRNSFKIDGKNFTFDNRFNFQLVSADTQIIIFDDVKKKFNFEKLFSILTEGMTIEQKNIRQFQMAYDKSPKILITTNHTVEGTDDSALDRQFVVEFSDHYNARHRPVDEFGHLFFNDWNENQWAAFYNYMIECCRYYLQNGLTNYNFVNLIRKQLRDSTAPEFEEFCKGIELNKEYNKKELFAQFKTENEDFDQMKQHTFSRWLRVYADLYHYEMTEHRQAQERMITFTNSPSL